ncbi:MAG: hypothetical protein ABI627_08430 [Polyangiaceae bacterium]
MQRRLDFLELESEVRDEGRLLDSASGVRNEVDHLVQEMLDSGVLALGGQDSADDLLGRLLCTEFIRQRLYARRRVLMRCPECHFILKTGFEFRLDFLF